MHTVASAATLSFNALYALFCESFKGYFVPIATSVEVLADRCRAEDVDMAASLLVLANGVPVGLALIARRGHQSRVSAMGIVAAHRGRGAGRILLAAALAQARARGDARMILEVIGDNAPALALYRKGGFIIARKQVGYLHAKLPVADDQALRLGSHAAMARLAATDGPDALPWQLDAATLASATSLFECYELEGAMALAGPTATGMTLRILIVPRALRGRGLGARLLYALAARYPGACLVGSIVSEEMGRDWFDKLGFTPHPIWQYEMEYVF